MNQKNKIINKFEDQARPTKQRILIAKNLFDKSKTFIYCWSLNKKKSKK